MHTVTLTRRTMAAAIIALVVTPALVAGATAWATTRSFSDVPWSHPFAGEINWAAENDIVEGYPDGTFRPSGTVTRQAAVAFLSRYNSDITLETGDWDPGAAISLGYQISCPAGRRAMAGGGHSSTTKLVITSSYPATAGDWKVEWTSIDGTPQDPSLLEAWVMCMPFPMALG